MTMPRCNAIILLIVDQLICHYSVPPLLMFSNHSPLVEWRILFNHVLHRTPPQVTVHVDYVQPKTATLPDERVCGTVKCGPNTNLAQLLLSQGLAQLIRYRNPNDARSGSYDELVAADEAAQTQGLGLHSKHDPPMHRVVDLSGRLVCACSAPLRASVFHSYRSACEHYLLQCTIAFRCR